MFHLKKEAIVNKVPIISREVENLLWRYLKQYKPCNVVEIWSAIWYSTLFIAKIIWDWNWIITTFEVSFPNYRQAISNIKKYDQIHNTKIYFVNPLTINLDSLFLTKSIDLLFIDAAKKEYLNFYLHLLPYLSPESKVIVDNMIKFKKRTSPLYKFLKKNQVNYEIFLSKNDWVVIF